MAISVYFDGRLIKQLGAYVKTDLSAVRQINGTATGVVALLGLAEGGLPNTAYRVLSYAEAAAIFKGGPLLDHVKAAFLGGAGEVVAVRVGNPTPATVSIPVSPDGTSSAIPWNFTSYEASARSNSIYVSFEIDTEFTSSTSDDNLILSIFQKHPDCSITKETYVFPRKFTDVQVLVKRGNTLFFVDRSLINAAKASSNFQTTLINLLKTNLNQTDIVQIFDASPSTPIDVPLGLVLYEILYGGLFGFTKSRLVTTSFGSSSDLFSSTDLFSTTASPFYNGTAYLDYTTLSTTNVLAKTTFSVNDIVDTTINPNILASYVFSLSGGSNGDDGTGFYGTALSTYVPVWNNALASLEEEEVNFIVPAYRFLDTVGYSARLNFFKTVSASVLAHINLMSQVNIRKRRVGILGFPAPDKNTASALTSGDYLRGGTSNDSVLNVAASLFGGTDRIQAIVSPFYSTVFNDAGKEELLGGEFLASFMAGMHANREPQNSVTFLPIAGLGLKLLYDWKYAEKDDLISNRIFFIEKVKNSFGAIQYRIHHNPTAFTGPVTVGFQELILRRIDDFLTAFVYKNLEQQFVGRPSKGQITANEIKAYTETLLSRVKDKQIAAFKDVTVTSNEDKNVYYVELFYQPITEIKFILVTMKVSFDLA
ncbi:MAG: hypothetical protein QXP88_00260 [Thermoproteota archaeon]